MKENALPVILIGGGGHAKVLIEALRKQNVRIEGLLDKALSKGEKLSGVPVLGKDENIENYSPKNFLLVNAVGTVHVSDVRKNIFNRFKSLGYSFAQVIHPSAVIASDVQLGEGVQIMAGAVLQPGVSIDDNAIINTRASLDHDCRIGKHVHVAPGATLCGSVTVEEGCHIGAGAVVVQETHVQAYAFVKANSVCARGVLN